MFKNRLHKQLENAIEHMYNRCHHFYIMINDKNNFKFILISSINNEYTNILNCDIHDGINYKYFIGVKEDSDVLINGLYSLDNHISIYEEELRVCQPESKYGKHIVHDKDFKTIKDSISPYSDYSGGSWDDLMDLYNELSYLSSRVLDSEYINKEIMFWDDGTYEFTFYKNKFSDKDKFIINKYLIDDDINKQELYEDTEIFFAYNWQEQKCTHQFSIQKNHESIKKQTHTICEYDVLTNFEYIKPVAKSEYLFDFSKTH